MLIIMSFLLFFTASCKTNNKADKGVSQAEVKVVVPQFNADSAYNFVQAQVDFGPRVPNTKQHIDCGEFLAQKLQEFGAKVTNQYADLIAYDGTILKARNIIGAYKPESKKRLLLFAHWDTRPFADHDPDAKNHRSPILGANDGASGVGVLLEIARQINMQQPQLGIDIIFFDAEDYGAPQDYTGNATNDYGLGSQYWSRYPHVENYNARFGILLDMVGGRDAQFLREGTSEEYASHINRKVWKTARELGYGNYFIDKKTGGVVDDHFYVNKYARIPSIDIIPSDENYSFGSFWHSMADNMSIIDKETLKAVGQTVLTIIYNEK